MSVVTTYKDVPEECILFFPYVEWTILESLVISEKKYDQYYRKGYPRIHFDDGSSYRYIPVNINGKKFKIIPGERPILEKKEQIDI